MGNGRFEWAKNEPGLQSASTHSSPENGYEKGRRLAREQPGNTRARVAMMDCVGRLNTAVGSRPRPTQQVSKRSQSPIQEPQPLAQRSTMSQSGHSAIAYQAQRSPRRRPNTASRIHKTWIRMKARKY